MNHTIPAFESFTSIRLPSGNHLFFPELGGHYEEPRRVRHQEKFEVRRIAIVELEPGARLIGSITGATLQVGLRGEDFERLRDELRERDLTRQPITFSFVVDEHGALQELRRDGQAMADGPRSHIEELRPNDEGDTGKDRRKSGAR